MPLDSLAAQNGGLDEFRITAPREITAMLKQFQDGNVLLNLNGNERRDAVDHAVVAGPGPQPAQLQRRHEHAGDAAPDRVRRSRRRGLPPPTASRSSSTCRAWCSCAAWAAAPSARLPRELFRFQRRNSFRVGRCCAARRWRACATRASPRCSWRCASSTWYRRLRAVPARRRAGHPAGHGDEPGADRPRRRHAAGGQPAHAARHRAQPRGPRRAGWAASSSTWPTTRSAPCSASSTRRRSVAASCRSTSRPPRWPRLRRNSRLVTTRGFSPQVRRWDADSHGIATFAPSRSAT